MTPLFNRGNTPSIRCLIAAAFALAAQAQAQAAEPVFGSLFTDHAVLQRDQPITIWGKAAPSAGVTVSLGQATLQGAADASGTWRLTLPAMPAGGPYTLSARTSAGTSALKDIMVGDVFLCGGQSNMAYPARLATGAWDPFRSENNIRFVNIPNVSAAAPQASLNKPATWKVAGPDTTGEASAVCYHMARTLQQDYKVPMGLVSSNWGGTTIQGWISPASLATVAPYDKGLAALALMATDPKQAMADEARRHQAWWDANDPASKAQAAFMTADFDDSAWPALPRVGPWKQAGIAELANFDGAVWLRTSVTLTEAQAANANALQLGPVDNNDSTWVNGVRVGGGSTAWMWRDYAVPPGVFKAGRNVIAMRMMGGANGGGLAGSADNLKIVMKEGQPLALSGPWKYQRGMAAKGLSIPSAPWEVPTSLSTLHNAMLAPLAGYKFKLATWYQGESNTGAPKEYATLLPLLMADWRKTFGQPELPFLVAQLSAYGKVPVAPGDSGWAQLRQAQADAVKQDQHAALIVTVDVGDRFDIHPSQKAVVGERMARAARAVAYGQAGLTGSPESTGVIRSGRDLLVSFRHAGAGLRTYSAAQAIGFEACTAKACRYVPALAQGGKIRLTGANQPGVTHVRYAWADAPYVNLYNADDLPAVPFEMAVGKQ